jgi:Glyoxalase-like domain
MILGIDHVALATADPDATAADLEARLGLAAGGGGRHEALGTFNRLIWLGDAYLELIGVFDPALARRSWLGKPVLDALASGSSLVTWVIAVDDLDGALRWGPPEGGLIGPSAGERRRPDGRVVKWRIAHPETATPTSPGVIEHDVAAAEWTPPERAARAAEVHPLGGRVRLAGIEVVAGSPPTAAAGLRRLLAVPAEPAGRRAVRVRIGHHEVRFVGALPRGAGIVDLVADVRLRTRVTWLQDCEIRLRGMPVEIDGREAGAGQRGPASVDERV